MAEQFLSWAAPLGSWLVTYMIHSAILVALAYLIARRIETRRPQLGDVAWKVALVGALVTSGVQMKTGLSPLGGALGSATAEVSETTTGPVLDPDWAVMASVLSDPQPLPEPAAAAVEPTAAPAAATAAQPPRVVGANLAPVKTEVIAVERAPAWLAAVVAAWLAGALIFGGGLLFGWARLRWRLRRREPLKGTPAELLDRVAWRAGLRKPIRLSVVDGLDVPIAFGVLEPEIALPARAEHLEAERLEALLAHECAHLVRRDPGWRLLGSAVRSLLWVQPLNRLVCRRLESCSELCADDWAVAHTDRPLDLARCLTEVAGWLTPRGLGASVPAMARPGSVLGVRVRRLVADTETGRGASRWFGVAAVAVVAAIAFAAPGASSAAAPVSPVLPSAESAEPPAVEAAPAVSPEDAERAARALSALVHGSSGKAEVGEMIARLQASDLDDQAIDALVGQWLAGPGLDPDDFEIELDFEFDLEIELDDSDTGDGADDSGASGDSDTEVLDPRDFIDGYRERATLMERVHPGVDIQGGQCSDCHRPGAFTGSPRGDVDVDVDVDVEEVHRELQRALDKADSCGDDGHTRRHAERARRHAERVRRRVERLRQRYQQRAQRLREQAQRRVMRSADEAQRRALEQAMKARGEALEQAAEAREQVERARREAERAQREAERIRRRMER